MVISVEEYQKLKKQVDQFQAEANRAQGAFEQQMQKLEEEFACKSIEEGEKLLEIREKEEKEIGEEYQESYNKFVNQWQDGLGL